MRTRENGRFWRSGATGLLLSMAWACGAGESNSETDPSAGGSGATGGTPATSGGAGGSSGSGTGMAGAGGSGGGSACSAPDGTTEAVHIVMSVTWPGTTAGKAGSGTIHVWDRLKLTVNGGDLEGTMQPCGTLLPEAELTAAGQLVTGGDKILLEFPDAIWDAPTMEAFDATATHGGWDSGESVGVSWISLIGLSLDDAAGPWPAAATDVVGLDADGDGKPGYTPLPREGDGYVLPPTGLGLFGSAPSADRVYLVSRHIISISGTRDSCESHSGTADVMAFDSHVLGCHVKEGEDCNADQADFVDQNRMRYEVTSATYESKRVANDASCADIRAALPL